MKINKSIVCLIPARSGSKRIKNKNIKTFCGKPIIEWVIKNVKKTNTIKQIILSTDSRRYANLVKKYNVKVPFLRPKKISDDVANDNDVIKHFLNFDKNYDKYKYILYIYPTAVLSTPSIIKKSFYEFKKKKCSKLYPVSIFNPPIQHALSLDRGNKIKSKYGKFIKISSKNTTKHFYDVGQFYWINVKEFLNKNKNDYGYIVDKHNAIDIDYIEDFKLAESIFRHRNKNVARKVKKKFSKVSIGTAQFGNKYGATNKKKIIFNDIKKIFSSAKKDQILYFDTAQSYGNSESIIGKFSKRKNFKITTKFNKKNFDLGKSIHNLKNIPECVMFHSIKDYMDKKFRSRIIKFCKIYKIKNIGISLYYNDLKYLKKVDKSISTFQIPLNILDQRFLINQNFINFVQRNKIKLEARTVFLQGFLFKKPSYVFKKFKVSKHFSTTIMKILKKNKISLAELSYSWIYNNKMINKVIVGLNSYSHYLSLKKFKFLNKKDLILIKKSYSHSKNADPRKW